MKFLEKYRQVLTNLSFASKLTSLLMLVFILSELCESVLNYIFNAEAEWINTNWNKISIYVFFLTILSLLFAARFISLSFKSTKSIWVSQFLWCTTWLTILIYHLITNKITYGGFLENKTVNCLDCYYGFLWASNTLIIFLMGYLSISPIKQTLTLLFSSLPRNNFSNAK